MRYPSPSSLPYLAVALCGCGEVTGLPSAEPIPVLQGLLVLGEARHLLHARWSSPTHLPYDPTDRPVDESLVDLWLVAPTGDSVPYAPTGVAGEFAAEATVNARQLYRLSGTIASRAVTAETTIPGGLLVALPAEDTLRVRLDEAFRRIPFAWRAESAASYQALVLDDDGTRHTAFVVRALPDSLGILLDIAPDTTGELLIDPPEHGVADTAPLLILGYDRTATAFFSSTTKGNVHGAFGLFGGAAKAEKVILWE